mmetsp:Transcript_24203/g.45696  ORF Transcript_24203/g.45696 Transcript_24203/m.45696 type:complete len:160 (+) Transcript_24203:68-547(+)
MVRGLLASFVGHANATGVDSRYTGTHACVTSFVVFLPKRVASQADHFLPDIPNSWIMGGHDSNAPLDQPYRHSSPAGRCTRILVSFGKEDEPVVEMDGPCCFCKTKWKNGKILKEKVCTPSSGNPTASRICKPSKNCSGSSGNFMCWKRKGEADKCEVK